MAHFPYYRPRRMRTNEAMRSLVRENELQVTDLMYPIFVVAGENIKEEIQFMGPTRLSAIEEAQQHVVGVIRRLDEAGEIYIGRGDQDAVVK